jgi:hypothetical protein
VAVKEGPHKCGELAPHAPRFFLHWQEALKALPLKIAFSNSVAVWFELREKPSRSKLMNRHARLHLFAFERRYRSYLRIPG